MGSIPITRSIFAVADVTDWLNALIGGALIGRAATLLLWSIGRIAGGYLRVESGKGGGWVKKILVAR